MLLGLIKKAPASNTCGSFHTTAVVRGGIRVRGSPGLTWRLKQELDEKNKIIRAQKAEKKEKDYENWMDSIQEEMQRLGDAFVQDNTLGEKKWKSARKKIVTSNLFGPYPEPCTEVTLMHKKTLQSRRWRPPCEPPAVLSIQTAQSTQSIHTEGRDRRTRSEAPQPIEASAS